MSRKNNYKYVTFTCLFILNLSITYILTLKESVSIKELEEIANYINPNLFIFISVLIIVIINIIVIPNIYKVIFLLIKKKYSYIEIAIYYLLLNIPSIAISHLFVGLIEKICYVIVYLIVLFFISKRNKEDFKFYFVFILGLVILTLLEICQVS